MGAEFISNSSAGIKVPDLAAAEKFYTGVLGFELHSRHNNMLVFNTGHFILYVEGSDKAHPPVLSFSTSSSAQAKEHIIQSGCEIVREFEGGFWFKDPFGITYDVIEHNQ